MSIVEIDDGFAVRVPAVDDRWIFRFARRAGVVGALETEIALLPAIAPLLPVAVPRFEYVSREPAFVVYALIEGLPLVADETRRGEGVSRGRDRVGRRENYGGSLVLSPPRPVLLRPPRSVHEPAGLRRAGAREVSSIL